MAYRDEVHRGRVARDRTPVMIVIGSPELFADANCGAVGSTHARRLAPIQRIVVRPCHTLDDRLVTTAQATGARDLVGHFDLATLVTGVFGGEPRHGGPMPDANPQRTGGRAR